MTALAVLTDKTGSSSLRSKNTGMILDPYIGISDALPPETGTKDIAALSIAFLQADRAESAFTYVQTAQALLDRVINKRAADSGGFCENEVSSNRNTADNIWLYAAFSMLAQKTGSHRYEEAAKKAESFVQSMRSADAAYFLPGDLPENAAGSEFVSVETQAMAAIVMNDRTGLGTASSLLDNNGLFIPDNISSGHNSPESASMMALAYKLTGLDDEYLSAVSAISRIQLTNGSIPETTSPAFSDGFGKYYYRASGISATAWFAIAANGSNPFTIK
jgi:uncharacterized protein YyaL (SSP411 family)